MRGKTFVRKAHLEDGEAIWDIFRTVIKTGDTYAFPPDMEKDAALGYWLGEHYLTHVAGAAEAIEGTYVLKANQLGLGSHVANGSYMVHPRSQGKGFGKLMGLHSIEQAKRLGFMAIQFNLVVSTNTWALKLWKSLGFRIVGTVPKAFQHKSLGYVDAHILYLALREH